MSNTYWTDLSEAYEILNLSPIFSPEGNVRDYILTYKGGQDPSVSGDTVMTGDAWVNYVPPDPYTKNTTRYLQFNQSHFISSPGAPLGETQYISTSDDPNNPGGYTWGAMSFAQNAMWPYFSEQYSGISENGPFYAGYFTTTPPEGALKITNNFKAQDMKFWANENNDPYATAIQRFRIYDPNGNGYIMHASGVEGAGQVEQQFDKAVLPDGWSKEKVVLNKNYVLSPAFGEGGEYGTYNYNLIRDSADNTYHQFIWAKNGVGVNSRYEDMIIWGGSNDDLLIGDQLGNDGDLPGMDHIHGAQGDDTIRGGLMADTLWGDAGHDRLFGGMGDDTLHGGDGHDRLTGGSGNDSFYLSNGDDLIDDFASGDLLYIDSKQFGGLLQFMPGIAGAWISTTDSDLNTFVAFSPEDRLTQASIIFEN